MEDRDRELADGLLLAGGERQAELFRSADDAIAPDVDLQLEWAAREVERQPQLADVEVDGRRDADACPADRQVQQLTALTRQADGHVDGQTRAGPSVSGEPRGAD